MLLRCLASWMLLRSASAARHGEDILQKLAALKQFQPEALVDVGANRGTWSERARNFFRDTSTAFLLLEASEQHRASLEQVVSNVGSAEYKIALLSGHPDTELEFYDGGNTGNSIFRENTHHYDKDVPVRRKTFTLDQLVQASSVLSNKTVDIVKIDVQGAELMVLEGAHRVLEQTTFLQLEISNVQFNIGGACGWQIHEFLHRYGFVIYDIGDVLYGATLFKTHGIGQYDVLYVKPDSPRLPGSLKAMSASYCPLQGPSNSSMAQSNDGRIDRGMAGSSPTTNHAPGMFGVNADVAGANRFLPPLYVHLHSFSFGLIVGLLLSKILSYRAAKKMTTTARS